MENSTKMGADKLAENTPNVPKINRPKVWDFDEKRLHWASVVRETRHYADAAYEKKTIHLHKQTNKV